MTKRFILALVLCCSVVSAQTIKIAGRRTSPCALAFVNQVSTVSNYTAASTGTTEVSPSITLTSGNGAFVLVTVEEPVAINCEIGDITVTDSGGVNTWNLAKLFHDPGASDQCTAMFYSGITSTAAVTVTATFAVTGKWRAIAVAQYSGVAVGNYTIVSDATATSDIAVASAAWTTSTINTVASDDLIIGGDVVVGAVGTANTPTAPANERLDANPLTIEDKLCTSTTTIAGNFAGSTRNMTIGLAIKRLP